MSPGGLVEWFTALPLATRIFFGIFLLFIAAPIATLIALQFMESIRSLNVTRVSRQERDKAKGKSHN